MTDDTWASIQTPWYAVAESTDGRPPGGQHWGDLIAGLRRVQDLVAGSDPTDEIIHSAARRLHEIAEELDGWHVPEHRQAFGRRLDLPGVGQSLRPQVRRTRSDRDHWSGEVTFTRVYLGAGSAVHGGVVALLFDSFLGGLAHADGRTPCRTAYLHIDYRALTPLDQPLTVEAWFDTEAGRKRLLKGRLSDGRTVCAEAEGLFIVLREDQVPG